MENYLIKREVFVNEAGAFKSVVAMNKKTKKDYLLTIYDLIYYKDKSYQICQKIISICQTIKLYRCCQVFFDHEVYTFESIRPSNIGTYLKKFVVVEPFPMVSLADYYDSRKINADTVINGFSTIFKTLSKLHFLNIGYGCLSPLNIIVNNGNFSLRPPNLSKYQCSCTPPPLVARKKYRLKTEIVHYPHDRNLKNSKKTDCLCFGYLLCDYILYFGRNISFLLQKRFRNIGLYFKKFSLPSFIMVFLKSDHDVFYDESVQRKLKQFLVNRKKLLELYLNRKYVDPATFNEISEISDKQEPKNLKKYPSRERHDFNRLNQQTNSRKKIQNKIKTKGQIKKTKEKNIRKSKNTKNVMFNNDDFTYSETEEYQIITNQNSDREIAENHITFKPRNPEPKKVKCDDFNNNNSDININEYQYYSYSDEENYNQKIQCINNCKHQTDDQHNFKIDNVECYTIHSNPNLKNPYNDNQVINNMNLDNIPTNNERFGAYSEAYECDDSDDLFYENEESDGNIEQHNILDSSDSADKHVDDYNIKHKSKNHHHKNPNNNNMSDDKDNRPSPSNHAPCIPKKDAKKQTKDPKKDFQSNNLESLNSSHIFIIRFKYEYDKIKYPDKKFCIHIFTGEPQKSKTHNFLTIDKRIADIKHHHVTKEIRLNESMYRKCQKEGITVCIQFNHSVHRDLIHLNLRNISFIPFYDNNLNLMFSVQTTFEEK